MVVGKLSPDGPSIPHLVCVKELSKVNSQAIAYFVNKGLQSLYSGNIDDSKVLFFCTDAASYMVAATPLLKTFYPNLTHVTCLAHGLHRVSETIRNEFPLVNSFISNTKKCFCKAPSRISIFRENFPDIPLPSQPIVTRWGTWIQSVVYYSKYFKEVVTVIDKLPETDSATCVKAVKDCLNDSRVKNDIAYITSNFSFIPASIEQLEREKQSLCSQIAIVKEAQVNIHSALGETGKKLKIKTINIRYPPQNWLHLYTDGSLISREQGAGAGVTCCLFSLYRSHGYGTTSFDGDIIAISESLRNLLCHINKFKNAIILSDSKAAVLSINKTVSSQFTVRLPWLVLLVHCSSSLHVDLRSSGLCRTRLADTVTVTDSLTQVHCTSNPGLPDAVPLHVEPRFSRSSRRLASLLARGFTFSEKARASKPAGVRLECASASASASEGLSSSAVDRSWRDLSSSAVDRSWRDPSSSTVNCLWRSVVRDTVNSSD
ncbi:hypothetical protein ANN_22067 [Periplaneta americana]|uniref:DUF659 domain-containing protein n=1 Tax=Periplaneta americana TaxID=6978 RepID=A0ABQ8S7E4_PERAM|nr:hypothetical protein ANN_22067 [Periplaneta americana]